MPALDRTRLVLHGAPDPLHGVQHPRARQLPREPRRERLAGAPDLLGRAPPAEPGRLDLPVDKQPGEAGVAPAVLVDLSDVDVPADGHHADLAGRESVRGFYGH